MDDPAPGATYSVSLRLRRVTVEYAYVNVPIVDEVVKLDEKGVGRIDPSELTRRALAMGLEPEVVWYREDQSIELHPIQQSPHEGELRFPF
jgi:hypothetical protein